MSLTADAIRSMGTDEVVAAMQALSHEMVARMKRTYGVRVLPRIPPPPVEADEILALLNDDGRLSFADRIGRDCPNLTGQRARGCSNERPAGRPRLRIVK